MIFHVEMLVTLIISCLVGIALLFIPRNPIIGIRIKETLSNRQIWNNTNRLMGGFMLCNTAGVIPFLYLSQYFVVIFLTTLLASLLIAVIYAKQASGCEQISLAFPKIVLKSYAILICFIVSIAFCLIIWNIIPDKMAPVYTPYRVTNGTLGQTPIGEYLFYNFYTQYEIIGIFSVLLGFMIYFGKKTSNSAIETINRFLNTILLLLLGSIVYFFVVNYATVLATKAASRTIQESFILTPIYYVAIALEIISLFLAVYYSIRTTK